ncbi:MAG: hypothetical protein KA210_05110 [Bacteroidia bacterium]|nr:hypothetical protein [Bacteroidia bacterium]
MKIPLIVIFLFFNISLSFSQKIQVFGDNDKKPISYVTVVFTNQDKIVGGDYCDENGFMKIDDKMVFDKFELSCIGYESKAIEKGALKNDTIFLKNKVINLDEVVISKNNLATSLLGYTDLKKYQYAGIGKGLETVVFIENNAKKPLYISSFLFKVQKVKKKTAIRIHFYKKQLDKFEPGKEILTEDIVEYLDENTQGLVEINIAKYGLELPIEGSFVGIEALGVFDNITKTYVDTRILEENLGLEYNTKIDKSITFLRNRFKSKFWGDRNEAIRRAIPNFKKFLNLSFGVKVFNK